VQASRLLVLAATSVPRKRSWQRSLALCALLSLSITLYLILIHLVPQGNNCTPFLSVWMISFLPYLVACVMVLATKPATGGWLWAELALIFAGAFVMRVMLLPLPPLLSRDSWRYVWDARVILHGYSPYVYAPANPVLLPLRDNLIYSESRFRDVPTIYPPGAQALFVLSYLLAPSNLFFLKGIFVGFDLATCGLLALLLTRKSLDPRRVIIYAWCPLPIVEFAIQGHVDAAMITFMVLALLCASSNKRGACALTGFLIGMATLTKIYPILLLVAVVRRREWTSKQSLILLTCFATIILGYLPFLILGHGQQPFGFFSTYASEQGENAGVVQLVTFWIAQAFGLKLATTVGVEHVVDLVVVGTVSMVIQRLGERISMETATVLLIGMVFAISSHVFPWYTTVLLPWIAMLVGPLWRGGRLSGKGLAVAMAWYFTFTVLYGYYLRDSLVWASYYALVYDAVLVGLVVAAVAEVRKARAVPG
jgi:hypothetical protein